ncbi:hypothetical protein pipiens_012633 [Culex pipiens pipiens]|uniref:Uncharacterized protein n=1 Tax=Culex pipiens pipiens TaxID=38569 RepID=A0ABD1D1J5_CULPP
MAKPGRAVPSTSEQESYRHPNVLFRGAEPLAGLGVERIRTDEANLNAVTVSGRKKENTPFIVTTVAQIILNPDCRAIKRG